MLPNTDEPPSVRTQTTHAEFRLQGIPAAPGIVIGRAGLLRFEASQRHDETRTCDPVSERERFNTAHQSCIAELQTVFELTQQNSPTAAPIIEAQLLMMQAPSIATETHEYINEGMSA